MVNNNSGKFYNTRSSKKDNVFYELKFDKKPVKRKSEDENNDNKKKKKTLIIPVNDDEDSMDDFIVYDESSVSEEEEYDEDEEEYDEDEEDEDEEDGYMAICDYEKNNLSEVDTKLNEIISNKLKKQIMDNVLKRLETEEAKYSLIEDEYDDDYDDNYDNESRKSDYDKKINVYFNSLSKEKQEEYINKENEIKNLYKNEVPLKYKVLDMDTTVSNKAAILQRVEAFEKMSNQNEEYTKLMRWVNGMKLLPFGRYKNLNVSMSDGKKNIAEYLNNVYDSLDSKLYGQYGPKNKLMQIIAQWISNPKSQSTVLALEGPPGVGKTSLIKNGLSKALDLPFGFMALGGSNDVSNFTGFGYTYEGATYGNIAGTLIKSGYMNPIIFMDELDKISMSEKGKEIIGMLTHLTDPTQNSTFVDKYFDGIEMDLSKVFFVFSFNNLRLIDPILRDRLNIIKFDSYTAKDKRIIVKKYILPEILNNVGLKLGDIVLSDENINYIIMKYTNNEKGVRNMRRCLEDIVMKLNLIRMVKKEKSNIVFPFDIKNINIELPITVNNEMIKVLLKNYSKDTIPDFVKNLYS